MQIHVLKFTKISASSGLVMKLAAARESERDTDGVT